MKLRGITFEDVFALVVALICFYFIFLGIDKTVSAVLLSVASFYFGSKHRNK